MNPASLPLLLAAAELSLVRLSGGPVSWESVAPWALGWAAITLLASRVGTQCLPILGGLFGLSLLLGPLSHSLSALIAASLAVLIAGWGLRNRPEAGPLLALLGLGLATALDGLPFAIWMPAAALVLLGLIPRPWVSGVALSLTATACLLPWTLNPSDKPDVVVITVDTLRADTADTMASVQRLQEEGQGYLAYAPSPWTLPSMATLMTGRFPEDHGAGRGSEGYRDLHPDLTTLPQWAEQTGYTTIGISAGNVFTGAAFGLLRDFQIRWHPWAPSPHPIPRGRSPHGQPMPLFARPFQRAEGSGASELLTRGLKALNNHAEPVFLWIHLMDVHLPYASSPCRPEVLTTGSRTELLADPFWNTPEGHDCYRAGYEAATQRVDAALLEFLNDLPADARLVLTSDHGESLGEVGLEHGHTLHPEVTKVPLLTKNLPPLSGPSPHGLHEIAPLLFSAEPFVSAGHVGLSSVFYGPPQRGVVTEDWMLIQSEEGEVAFPSDAPPERRSASPSAELHEHLWPLLPPRVTPDGPSPDMDRQGQALRALGYVE